MTTCGKFRALISFVVVTPEPRALDREGVPALGDRQVLLAFGRNGKFGRGA
jgi:hypothetical protein